MSTNTPRVGFYMPADDGSEPINVATDLNDNLERLDTAIGFVPTTSSSDPASMYDGMAAYETDTGRAKFRKGASIWTYLVTAGTSFMSDLLLGAGKRLGIGTNSPTTPIEIAVDDTALNPTVFRFRQTTDTYPRLQLDRDGIKFGAGTTPTDIQIYRPGPNQLSFAAITTFEQGLNVSGPISATSADISSDLNIGGNVVSNLNVVGDFTATGFGFTKFIRKTADTVRTSTATVAADPHLTFAAEANANYVIETYLFYTADVAVDIKFNYSVPAGASGIRWVLGVATEATSHTNITMRSSAHGATETPGIGSAAIASGEGGKDTFVLNMGATAGNVTFQWSQNTSSANALTLRMNSFMKVTKVA